MIAMLASAATFIPQCGKVDLRRERERGINDDGGLQHVQRQRNLLAEAAKAGIL